MKDVEEAQYGQRKELLTRMRSRVLLPQCCFVPSEGIILRTSSKPNGRRSSFYLNISKSNPSKI